MQLSLFFTALAAVSSVIGVSAQIPDSDLVDQSPAVPQQELDKRALCLLGLCVGSTTPNYQTDVKNCGSAGHVCPTSWPNGSGSQCVNGVCMPGSCALGYTLNTNTGACVNLASDPTNCGAFGKVCTLTGAASYACTAGTCQATACVAGYGLYSGTCKSLQSDPNNCGSLGNICQFPGGSGTCSAGVCTFTSCGAGYYLVGGKCTALNLQSDVNNCGTVGHVCSALNGVAGCSAGQCVAVSCQSGYTLSGGQCVQINLSSDLNNCGTLGNKCSFVNGLGACQNGVCVETSCTTAGFYLVNGQCTSLNLQTDPKNCGSLGHVCSVPNGVGECVSGACQIGSCSPGYTLQTSGSLLGLFGSSTSCTPVNTLSDVKNCGTVGNVCNFVNGGGVCSNGVCTYTSCASGSYLVNGQCSALNLQTDVKNCGSVGNVCAVPNGVASCSGGACQIASCNSGYSRTTSGSLLGLFGTSSSCQAVNTATDPSNCGTVGNVCPANYANGGSGTCVNGVCQASSCNSGYVFDPSYGFCRPTNSDVNNCGGIGILCQISGAQSQVCSNGQCLVSVCIAGFTLVNNQCVAANYQTDVKNCGSAGHVCSFAPAGAAGICQAGQCVTTSCPTGYNLVNGACALGPSARARAKRSKVTESKTLCPAGEQACPIAGSTLFVDASAQHFKTGEELTGLMARSGGYECLDTTQALESCGGCASTGEGQDCTAIPHAAGVGCEASKCIIFSCDAGYKPNLNGDKCIRARGSTSGHRNSTASHAKRHLSARRHYGHGSAMSS
ncbi:hypothetical protein JCM8202_000407 [Rhodotorula sphaerocarpa]